MSDMEIVGVIVLLSATWIACDELGRFLAKRSIRRRLYAICRRPSAMPRPRW